MSATLEGFLGPVLVTQMICFFCTGIVCTKAFEYYGKFPDDPWIFKALVAFSVGLVLANTAILPIWAYDWLVRSYGDPTVVINIPFSFTAANIINGFVILAVQLFFAWRIFKLGGGHNNRASYILPTLIGAVSLAQFIIVAVVDTVAIVTHPQWTAVSHGTSFGVIWGAVSIVGDVLITGSMLYLLLWKTRNHTFVETRSWLRAIVFRAVEMNLLSFIMQLVVIIVLKRLVDLWFLLATGSLPQIYCFSLLVSLNGRNARDGAGSSSRSQDRGLSHGRSLKLNVAVQSKRRVDQEPTVRFGDPNPHQTYDIELGDRKTFGV